MKVIRALGVLGLAAAFGCAAHADIKAFNAAVQAGDYKAAATEAKAAWPELDKAQPDITLIAREFGFASYMAGDYAAAADYGRFLIGARARDDQPATSEVLLRVAEYRLDPKGAAHNALLRALKARTKAADSDSISVLAASVFYRGEWEIGHWNDVREAVEIATTLLGRAGAAGEPGVLEARVFGVAASFLVDQNAHAYRKMYDVHDAIVDRINATAAPEKVAELRYLLFAADAWAGAMWTYFQLDTSAVVLINNDMKKRVASELKRPLFESTPPPNACWGKIDPGSLDYPHSATFAGLVGAVVIRFDFDADGKVVSHELLASAPAPIFGLAAQAKAQQFTRLRDEKRDQPDCRLDIQNKVVTVYFLVQ